MNPPPPTALIRPPQVLIQICSPGEVIIIRDISADSTSSLVSALAAEVAGHAGERVLIGLAGPPGSGKSTLARNLVDEMNARGTCAAAIMPMDGYHLSTFQLDRQGIASIRGAPETFDVNGFVAALARLRSPGVDTVYLPDYSRVIDEPIAASIAIAADTNVVVVEGNYLLLGSGEWTKVETYLTHSWFLDVEWEVCRQRLITRHTNTGKSLAAATEWVDRSDKVNYDLIVGGSRTAGVRFIRQGQARKS